MFALILTDPAISSVNVKNWAKPPPHGSGAHAPERATTHRHTANACGLHTHAARLPSPHCSEMGLASSDHAAPAMPFMTRIEGHAKPHSRHSSACTIRTSESVSSRVAAMRTRSGSPSKTSDGMGVPLR